MLYLLFMAKRGLLRSIPRLSKRSKFVLSTVVLSIGMLIAFLSGPGFGHQAVGILAFFAAVFTLFSLWGDLPKRKQVIIVLLPGIFFTIAAGFFYFVLPGRWVTRFIMLTIFAFGFYATLLVQNIYTISVARTIKLLQAARTIGFLIAVASAFSLYYILYSFHTYLPLVALGIFALSFLLIISVIWSVSLKDFVGRNELLHTCILSLVLTEIGTVLTFWPVSVTFAAIFLAGNFYTFVGLLQHWMENRLFKRVLWEFIWVASVLFVILFFTAKWGG